jgi:hypothetical protein
MPIGLARLPGRPGVQPSRTSETTSKSAREICLLGLAEPNRPPDWRPGASVVWQGREYEIESQDPLHVQFVLAEDRPEP